MSVAAGSQVLSGIRKRTQRRSRVEISEPLTFGERVADSAASAVGSWRFIIAQSILVVLWIAFNTWELSLPHVDSYPYVLLNLLFSVQAAYTGPILLLASNRQAAKDRALAHRDDEELGVIYKLQHEQMEMLKLLQDAQDKHTEILEMLRHGRPGQNSSPTSG